MPRFLTIGYGDRSGYDATSDTLRTAAHAQDAMLKAAGAVIGVAGRPVQVRNPGAGGVQRKEGAYLRSDLPIAGFALIEAADLEDAIAKVSTTPCAVAQGVVEVWPLDESR
ncbi:MAG: transcription initiation protein [Acetobacteraceae bacterium]|nr:MAG: transcription initiation protein [Acetobacteraceae bacterium]